MTYVPPKYVPTIQDDCGQGCNASLTMRELLKGNAEPYEICGACGQDMPDCMCNIAERAQCEADHQRDIREDR